MSRDNVRQTAEIDPFNLPLSRSSKGDGPALKL